MSSLITGSLPPPVAPILQQLTIESKKALDTEIGGYERLLNNPPSNVNAPKLKEDD